MAPKPEHPKARPHTEEKRTHWSFDVRPDDRWEWRMRRADGTTLVSPDHFATLGECVKDAGNHGYAVWLEPDPRNAAQKNSIDE